ncbi:MAG TPA: NTP transferase domain-containing protein [Patescibacteria group bacterium]|nr:NTP transferase domain-containing protein [Patescibacteria group bacterium]
MENIHVGAIVLAAGKGSRMKSKDTNKVTLMLADKPMIAHTVELLESVSVHPIVIVVGFAKQSVMNILGERVFFVEQKKRLGTAHAAAKGLSVLENMPVDHVLIIQGDDSAFYKKETIHALIAKHIATHAALTFLTINVKNPFGLGRVVRDSQGNLIKIVEEKDATEKERGITEINPACYVLSMSFLKKYLPKVEKSPVTGEYYLTHLIDLAIKYNEKVETTQGGSLMWRGVNTKEELEEAQHLFAQVEE